MNFKKVIVFILALILRYTLVHWESGLAIPFMYDGGPSEKHLALASLDAYDCPGFATNPGLLYCANCRWEEEKEMEIVNVVHRPDLLEKAVHVFWNQWGNESNFKLYEDAIRKSLKTESDLPLFYIMAHQEHIIGTYALLRNDMNSRQDLCPWLACLYVKKIIMVIKSVLCC